MSEALAEARGFSNRRGCLASLALVLILTVVIAVALLSGLLFSQ